MNNPIVSNQNDFKVVEFHNSTDFDFTPEMGCMYDGRPIFGISGAKGILAGERINLPYHIGHRLAVNLAKQAQIRLAPPHDPRETNLVGKPLWTDESLEALKNSFLTELYSEDKPASMSQTDMLMAKYEELKNLVTMNLTQPKAASIETPTPSPEVAVVYSDKAEVMAELTKRGIKFNARDSKATLEKLIV
jgi:hypothetical protein